MSIIRAGLSLSGWFTDGSLRNLYNCKLRVTSVKRSRIFGSLLPMTMTSTCTKTVLGQSPAEGQAPEKTSNTATGDYQIANRRWFAESEGYSSNCQFPDSTFRFMRCETYRGQTHRINAGMIAYRDED